MSLFLIVSLVLLGIVILDAVGDGLRWRGKQVAHHAVEILREAIWLAMVAYFMDNYFIITMYITARIALFDPVINLIAGKPIGYAGNSSIYDRLLRWFSGKVKEPGHLIWVIRALALIWFVAWILTNADGRF